MEKKRSESICPLKKSLDIKLCAFLVTAWEEGWLDEYSNEHFLIKAIEDRLETYVGVEQLIENNINMQGIVNDDGTINTTKFNVNFCINISMRLQNLAYKFGNDNIERFIKDQLSAGKGKYREDAFFEALSEISILSFFSSVFEWEEMLYEPPLAVNNSKKNPEARLIGNVYCKMDDGIYEEEDRDIIINIEVKSPEFPHDKHINEKIMIPTILLSDEGRKIVKEESGKNGITYLNPRVLKLKDFINSASEKFDVPCKNELNLLYINWSYRDFPSNSFLEAWSLMTNEINGILSKPEVGKKLGINDDAYKKITAVIVYTESLEGLMFSDFRYVWQRNGVGPRFRMWVLDEKLRLAEREDRSNILFRATGMNPSDAVTQMLMIDYKINSDYDRKKAKEIGGKLADLIKINAKRD